MPKLTISPFRYPGGKSWLAPYINLWLRQEGLNPHHFIEPFAGGASMGLLVAHGSLSKKVTLVEKDENVAAVWLLILSDDYSWLLDRIRGFVMNSENVRAELEANDTCLRSKAFRTLLRNRVSHGGIMNRRGGLLNRGEHDNGIGSRWYPETLCNRIETIHQLRHRIRFICGDGIRVFARYVERRRAFFFIDPPYSVSEKRAGERLYAHHEVDHERLFYLASLVQGQFLMTYDDDDNVRRLAQQYGFVVRGVRMRTRHHVVMQELLISNDLDWLPNHLMIQDGEQQVEQEVP